MSKLTPLVLIALAIGIFFFFTDDQYNQAKDLQTQKEENDAMLDLAKQLHQKREDLRSRFNSISNEDKDELKKLIPDTVDNVRLIRDINSIAETWGISIDNISVSRSGIDEFDTASASVVSTDTSDTIGTITLSFSVTSTYDVFINFIKSLENSLRLVDIRILTIDSGEGVFYNYGVTLDTYWLR